MAGYGSDDDGATNNGFGRPSLHQWEGRLLYAAGYPAPPDFRAPGGWRLSASGIPIPPPPMGTALDTAIDDGDAGQGSSRQAPPPQDGGDDSSDDGGDYTAFYRRLGM
jgi:hypothetical protein